MKVLLLTLLIALPLAYLFGEEEYTRLSQIEKISRAPGVARAAFNETLLTESKHRTSYRVRFRYEVDGQTFHVTTTPTDLQGAKAYEAQQDVQVAYSTIAPSVAMLKRYYDLRDPRDTLARSLTVTSAFALALALPIAMGLGWRLGWLKHGKK